MIPLRDDIRGRGRPHVVHVLILLNIACFALQIVSGHEVTERYALYPSHVADWWHAGHALSGAFDPLLPLLTSQFLHAGWVHLGSNLLFLWVFGDNIEGEIGSKPFLGFYLLAGVIAGLCHVYFEPDSVLPTVGASGAIAGVLGAYFIRFPQAKVLTLVPIFFFPFLFEIPALIFLGLWFGLQVFYGLNGGGGNMAVWAHAGGFVAGILLLGVFPRVKKKKPTARYRPGQNRSGRFERNA